MKRINSVKQAENVLKRDLGDGGYDLRTREGKEWAYSYLSGWRNVSQGVAYYKDMIYGATGREFSASETALLREAWAQLRDRYGKALGK